MIFDIAEAEGIKMNVLDIGGGFPGDDNPFFKEIATVINQQIEKHFPKNIKIIAEPGRFLVASCKTIVTRVISTRRQPEYMNYFTNEGIFGALNYIHFDTPSFRPEVLIQFEENDKIVSSARMTVNVSNVDKIFLQLKSTLWGPTCDGQDKLFDNFEMKVLKTGDYLIWFNIGAYSTESASNFNGFPLPKRFYTPCLPPSSWN